MIGIPPNTFLGTGDQAATCRLCGQPGCDYWWDERLGFEFYHCPRCGYRFKSSNALPDPEEEQHHYRLHQNEFGSKGYVRMNRRIMQQAILPFAPKPYGQALDFGCGPGPVLATMLSQAGWKMALYDPFFVPEFPYDHYRYQLITMVEVAEHLFAPSSILAQLPKLLLPGGIMVIGTRSYPYRREAFAAWWYRIEPTHVGFFQYKTWHYLARVLGLRILYHDFHSLTVLYKDA